MNCVKLLGQGLMARDFDRQVAEPDEYAVDAGYGGDRVRLIYAGARFDLEEQTVDRVVNKQVAANLRTNSHHVRRE